MAKLSSIDVALLNQVHALVGRHITPDKNMPMQLASPLLDSQTVKRSGYEDHFGWQLLHTDDSTLVLKPSTCFSVYDELKDTSLKYEFEALICAPVYRTESGALEATGRYNGFWMLEYVFMGSKTVVDARAFKLLNDAESIFDDLGIKVLPKKSTDAFFMDESRGSKLIQQIKGLKTEFIYGKDELSLGSLNRHEDYFGRRFGISLNGTPAHGLCMAFGLDRIADAREGRVT